MARFIEFTNTSGDQLLVAVDHISAVLYSVKKDPTENQVLIWTNGSKSSVGYGAESDRVWSLLKNSEPE